MKKLIYILSCLFFLTFISTTTTSCKTGEGCEAEEAYEKGQGKKLSSKRGKSRLFKNKKS